MQLQDILSQGFGTRRVCAGLVQQGWVSVAAVPSSDSFELITDSARDFNPKDLRLRVQGVEWPWCEKAYTLLYKPEGTECSQKPSMHPSVYTLFTSPPKAATQQKCDSGGPSGWAPRPGHYRFAAAQ